MSSPTYSELLKHPEWQKTRLKILEEHNFTCEHCSSKDKTLHVHHVQYKKGKKPWEYVDHNLMCLCEDCHKKQEVFQKDCINYLHEIFRDIMPDQRDWLKKTLFNLSNFASYERRANEDK